MDYNNELEQYLGAERLIAVALAVGQYSSMWVEKNPCRTSPLGGSEYVRELLASNPRRIIEVLRMSKATFLSLLDALSSRGVFPDRKFMKVSNEEALAIFLYIVGQNGTNRSVQERFQHSGETISRCFHQILNGVVSFYPDFVQLPDCSSPIPVEIRNNPKLFPYFKDCIGAIDGTHIPAKVSVPSMIPFRNRKGFISQNVLAACKFNLNFCYILPGWEGSAHDGRVLQFALANDFQVPDGKFYLGDAGYGLRKGFLTPYRGVRYHLCEQVIVRLRPETKQELFNLRHSQLWNVIERIFSVLKKRFPILSTVPEYPFDIQVKLMFALPTLHNFIRNYMYGEDDEFYHELELEPTIEPELRGDCSNLRQKEEIYIDEIEDQTMYQLREQIADEMWRDYQLIKRPRGLHI